MAGKVLKGIAGLFVFLAVLLPAVYTSSVYGYFPALFLLFSLLLSFICLQIAGKKILIESDFKNSECERGKQVSLGLSITNCSRIMCPGAAAGLFISDLFGLEDAVKKVYFTLTPGEKNQFGFDMDMPHIGLYHVGINNMEILDFFGVFRKKIPLAKEFDVYVTPRIIPLEDRIKATHTTAEASRDTRNIVRNGMDYTGVREYEIGDSMKQIHWKLSAHSLTYMTKLQESSRQMDFSVILDFAAEPNTDRNTLMDLNDCLIETALSLVDNIARHHTSYSLLYCNKNLQISRITPKGREDDLTMLRDFCVITPDPDEHYPDASFILQEEGSRSNSSSNVLVCTSRVTEALIQELLSVKQQKRNPVLYQIVPAGFSVKQLRPLETALARLEEAGIGHCFIYTTDTGGIDS